MSAALGSAQLPEALRTVQLDKPPIPEEDQALVATIAQHVPVLRLGTGEAHQAARRPANDERPEQISQYGRIVL
jgi:hypothetical protein